jgi:hypothetical protein
MECLEGCEYQQFVNKSFHCSYYEKDLLTEYGVEGDNSTIVVYRCQNCVEDGFKGIDQKQNTLDGIRKSLVYLGDHFYSFKDEFENCLADLYRNLKRLEKGD